MGALDLLFLKTKNRRTNMGVPTFAELQEYLKEIENDINAAQNHLFDLERLREQVLKEIDEMPERERL